MRWLALSLAGPGIWAAGFSAVYALHGTGCARDWPEVTLAGGVDLHHAMLISGWLVTLGAGAMLMLGLPRAGAGASLARQLPRTGGWIGLGATATTLLPVLLATSC
ncbi:MAG: hypothetical protein ACXIVG_07575 [Pararhodobacter sp.]